MEFDLVLHHSPPSRRQQGAIMVDLRGPRLTLYQ
jgi:hypothetical protein